MATLKELLDGGSFGEEKTASARATDADLTGMDKLAMELGLYGDTTTKTAGFEDFKKEKSEDKEDDHEDDKEEKKASAFSSNLHGLLFPDSVLGGASEKTASEKQAQAEFAMGAAAYDQFASAFDLFVEKLASEAMTGHALAGNPHGDSQPVNHLPNNKAKDAKEHINTTPHITDEVKKTNDERTVGHYEQHKTASAFRKHMLLSVLDNG